MNPQESGARGWPLPLQIVASLALIYHMAGLLVGALAVPPSAAIERQAVPYFKRYFELTNQGYSYRYYSRLDTTVDAAHPHPWGTPIMTADMEFKGEDGQVVHRVLRLPDRERPWPRLRFQRQLDLAYHLFSDPRWVASYARHLCKTRGCERVTIFVREHQIPRLDLVREVAAGRSVQPVDLEAESTYSPPIKLGEYRCTDF
jgi:hypothetical protein